MTPTAVLFDFYGTLAHATRWVSIDLVLAERGYVLPDDVRDRWWNSGVDGIEHFEHSQSRDDYQAWQRQRLLGMLAETDVHPGEYEAILEQFRHGNATRVLEAYPESRGVLAAFRDRGLAVGICSNWDWDLNEAVDEVGLSNLVDVVVSSAWAGARKPHPRIFEQSLAKLGADASEVAFVGDTWGPDVVGPQAMGMTPVYLRRVGHWPDDTAPEPLDEGVLVAADLRAVLDLIEEEIVTTTATPPTTTGDIPGTVARLRSTFESGKTRTVEWRREQLHRMRTMLVDREADFLSALAADLGKPATEAWVTDVGFVISEIDHALRHLRSWTRPERVWAPLVTRPARATIVREPLGVVLVIAPWNYPVQLLLSPLIGSIAAGNCAVGKPSEVAVTTSATLARLVPQYLDTEAVAIIEGAVPETQALLEERFDYIFYTGNGRVGRVVMEAAAKHLTPVTLELGGKSPVIVDDSANLEVAARRVAWGKYLNAGQTCIAPDYVLVVKGVEERFVEQVRRAVFDFYGPDPKQSPDYGRIVNESHLRRLVGLLDGGKATIGGVADEPDRYLAPTVLQEVQPDAAVMHDEIFGPILPVMPVSDVDEAIEFVNGRDKPLALYVFAGARSVRDRVLDRTSSGGAAVNGTMFHVAVPELPFGGIGASGMGAYHGKASFLTFSHAKSVLRKGTKPDPDLAYPPYTPRKDRLMRRFL